MPELPELETMREVLTSSVLGCAIVSARAYRPGVLKTVDPPLDALVGESFRSVDRRGKHLLLSCRADLWLVVHLMVAGRLVLTRTATKVTKATGLVVSLADGRDLRLVENGSKKMAQVHVVRGPGDVEGIARAGVEPLSDDFTCEAAARLLGADRRQLKKLLTDPSRLAGIRLSRRRALGLAGSAVMVAGVGTWAGRVLLPEQEAAEIERLHAAIRDVLAEAVARTRRAAGGALVGERRAEGMRVYKRTGEPCAVCGAPIAEIRFAETRTYYCPQCQSKGRTIADRRAWLRR